MRFQPDWLRRVLRVPYVPALGSVHPEALSPGLFDDVVAASQTGQLLPFDKDRRWSARKDQSVLVAEIIHQPEQTIIPVLSRRSGGMVKTYYYGTGAPDRDALLLATRRWCATYGASAGRVIWFDPVISAAGGPPPARGCCSRSSALTIPSSDLPPAGITAWATASQPGIDVFTTTSRRLWGRIAHDDPQPCKLRLHAATQAWAEHRMTIWVERLTATGVS